MKKNVLKSSLLVMFCTTLFSCSDDDKVNNKDMPLIEEINIVDTITVNEIKTHYKPYLEQLNQTTGMLNVDEELSTVKYDVVVSRVKYEAKDPLGITRTLSGLVTYPIIPDSLKQVKLTIASFQHGTISDESFAPSIQDYKDENIVANNVMSLIIPAHKNGYVMVMPDYFGYGEDAIQMHYYEHRASLVEATRKLIETIPSYIKEKALEISYDKLLLMGYSEGGFATMSTLKSFSETNSNFKNFVTLAGAGAYDKKTSAQRIVMQTTGESPQFTASYAWVLNTYNTVYKVNRELEKMYLDSVAVEMKKYIGGDRIMYSNLPFEPINTFHPDFSKGIVEETDTPFIDALNDNDVSNFDAKGTLELLHGTADTYVPTFNTDSAYVRLKSRGVDVTKTLVEGGKHNTSFAMFNSKIISKL